MKIGLLRNRIKVFSKTESKNEFGEITNEYSLLKSVWSEILPTNRKNEESVSGNYVRANITHKIIVRKGAIEKPRNDMYFTYQEQKYEVMYFIPHYQKNDLIEFCCKLIIEGEKDYGRN